MESQVSIAGWFILMWNIKKAQRNDFRGPPCTNKRCSFPFRYEKIGTNVNQHNMSGHISYPLKKKEKHIIQFSDFVLFGQHWIWDVCLYIYVEVCLEITRAQLTTIVLLRKNANVG